MFNKIIKYVNAYQLFQLMRYASMIIPAIFLSKFLYSKNDIGIYESFLLFSSVFSFFWLSAIFNTIFSDDQQVDTKNKNIKLAFWSIHILSIIVITIILISNSLVKYIENSYLYLLLIFIFFNNPSFIVENKFLLFRENKKLVIYGIIFLLVQISCSLIIGIMHLDSSYVLFTIIIFAFVRYLFSLYIVIINKADYKFNDTFLLLKKASPLLFSFFISGIAEYIDAFIIKYNFGNSELTLFRYGSREIPFVYILANSLSTSMIPDLRKDINEGLEELKKRSTYLIHLAFISTILLVITCQFWLPILFNESFVGAIPYFLISSLLIINRCVFPQTIIQAKQDRHIIFYFAFGELILNIISSLLFLSYFGAIGIVYGTLLSFITEKLLLIVFVYRKYQILPASYIQLKTYIFYSVLLITIVSIFYFKN